MGFIVFVNPKDLLVGCSSGLTAGNLNSALIAEAGFAGRIFAADGQVAEAAQAAAAAEQGDLCVLCPPNHPSFRIQTELDRAFGIRRILIGHTVLRRREDPSRAQLDRALESLHSEHFDYSTIQQDIDVFQKTLLNSLWSKLDIQGLGKWVSRLKKIFAADQDDQAKDFVKQYFPASSVDEAIKAFRAFIAASDQAGLKYSDETLAKVQSLFREGYSLAQEEPDLKLHTIKTLLQQLIVLVGTDFIVNTICRAGDTAAIVSADEGDRVRDVPFVKVELPLATAKSSDELYGSPKYFGHFIQQYLALGIEPDLLLAYLHDNRLFRFERDMTEIRYLIALSNHPFLMEACRQKLESQFYKLSEVAQLPAEGDMKEHQVYVALAPDGHSIECCALSSNAQVMSATITAAEGLDALGRGIQRISQLGIPKDILPFVLTHIGLSYNLEQYCISVINVVRREFVSGDFDAKTMVLLQQLVVSYLKNSGVLQLPLFTGVLSEEDKSRQALWFLIAILSEPTRYLPDLTGNQELACRSFSGYLRYVGLSSHDLRKISLPKLADDHTGEVYQPEQVIASVLSYDNVRYALIIAPDQLQSRFSFNPHDGLQVFLEHPGVAGWEWNDMLRYVLSRLALVSTDHTSSWFMHSLSFDRSFLENNQREQKISIAAFGIFPGNQVHIFNPREGIFVEAPGFTHSVLLASMPSVACLPDIMGLPNVTVVNLRLSGKVVFLGNSSTATLQPEYRLFPVANLATPPDGLDSFLKGCYSALFGLLQRRGLCFEDRRNILATLSLMRSLSHDVVVDPRWPEVLQAVLTQGTDVYVTYDGHFMNKGLEWLRFYGFSVLAIALGLFYGYHPTAGDQNLPWVIEPRLAQILLRSVPPGSLFSTTLIAGGGVLILGLGLYELFRFCQWLKSLCIPDNTQAPARQALVRAAEVREPMLIARLAAGALWLRDNSGERTDFRHSGANLYQQLCDIARLLRSADTLTSGEHFLLTQLTEGQAQLFPARYRQVRRSLAGLPRLLAPVGLGWAAYSAWGLSASIDDPAIANASTLLLAFVAKIGVILAGDGTFSNCGLAPFVGFFLMFWLFNLEWLTQAPRVAGGMASGVGRAISNGCDVGVRVVNFFRPMRTVVPGLAAPGGTATHHGRSEEMDRLIVSINTDDDADPKSNTFTVN